MFNGCKSFDADLSKWDVSNAIHWDDFVRFSLLANYLERIPEKFQ
jgi:surface protein